MQELANMNTSVLGIGSRAGTFTVDSDLDIQLANLNLYGDGDIVFNGTIAGGGGPGVNSGGILGSFIDIDEGARYFGEFALGVNPYITKPMLDTLFDEKISGSFHLTPGNSYDAAPNGNKSAQHWDIVLLHTPQCGGGEIWFDGTLVRKDGLFVLPELEGLNPENLK